MYADPITQVRTAPGLVERDPARYPIPQASGNDLGIVSEGIGRLTIEPATSSLQRRREIPVIERHERLNTLLQQRIDQPIIEIQASRIDGAAPLRHNTRPGNRKAIRFQSEPHHQVGIFLDPVVVVSGYLASVPFKHLAWRCREIIPDAAPPAILVDGTLDLIRGRSRTPEKARGKSPGKVGFDLSLDRRLGSNFHVF